MSHLFSFASTSRAMILPSFHVQVRFKSGKGAKPKNKASGLQQGKIRHKMGFKPARASKTVSKRDDARFKEAMWGSYDYPAPTPEERLKSLIPNIIPDLQTHETVTRAWQLHLRRQREERDDILTAKFQSLQNALKVLETINPPLYFTAIGGGPSGEGGRVFGNALQSGRKGLSVAERGRERLEGLFPRDMKVPMEILGRGKEADLENVWNEDWKMPVPVEEPKKR